MSDQTVSNVSKGSWWAALLGICLIIILYASFFSEPQNKDLAYLMGYYIPGALIVWAIFRAILRYKMSAQERYTALGLIYLSFVASGYAVASHHEAQINEVIDSLQSQLKQIHETGQDAEGYPQVTSPPAKEESSLTGEYRDIDLFMQRTINKAVIVRNDYINELDAIGWNDILLPSRIAADPGFVMSRELIIKGRGILEKYRGISERLMTETGEDLESLVAAGKVQKDVLNAFKAGLENSKRKYGDQWMLESQILEEIALMVELLFQTQGNWEIENNQFLFYKDADLQKFLQHQGNVMRLSEKQKQTKAAIIESMN